MNRIYFAIALHFHQPIGNFEHIFERAYKLCYRPFFELLSDYSRIKMMLHISGCLLDYLDAEHPETVGLVKKMASRNQIEIMGGGYYEPIFTAIPERDLMGQIRMMSDYIRDKFNVDADGIWIPERVWDPRIVRFLYRAGARYLVLDGGHLLRSGIKQDDIHGYFFTGKKGQRIAVFPSSKRLRYSIPFKPQQETLDYFKGLSKKKEGLLVTYGDDGEKFGEWPGTHTHVFKNQWLAKFFDMLVENKDWIKTVHFSDYIKNNRPTATLDIEQGSYEEMMEWSDGCWLNFLSRYPEANQIHKKMFYVSSKIEKLKAGRKKGQAKKIKAAEIQLYKGQCNCGYWHGIFGGLYLYHLRKAIYGHLIEADKLADGFLHKGRRQRPRIKEVDYDSDGKREVVIEDKNFALYIDPHEGGAVKELDYRPASFNLINTLSRKKEPYHQKILEAARSNRGSKVATIHDDFRVVDPGFKDSLAYDKFSRLFLRSYFVKKDLRLEDFAASSFEELGDFSTGAYRAYIDGEAVMLQRESALSNVVLNLRKRIRIKSKNEIEILSTIRKNDPPQPQALFGLEFNITMPDLNSERYGCCFKGGGRHSLNTQFGNNGVLKSDISDSKKELGIRFDFSEIALHAWHFPIRTVSQSERAYELNYQCSCLFFLWNPDFEHSDEYEVCVNIVFNSPKSI